MTRTFPEQLRVTVATLQATYPERADEVSRAYALLRSGMLVPDEDGQGALVQSSSDPDVFYQVNGTCDCPAGVYGKPCKHRSAWKLYQYVQKQIEAPRPTPAPETVTNGIGPKYVVLIHGKPFVRYAGLLALAHQRGLQELRVVWTYNSADLSLAEATAVFPFGTYQEAGDASPSNVKKEIAPSFRRMALTRAAARVLRNALSVDTCSIEELAEE